MGFFDFLKPNNPDFKDVKLTLVFKHVSGLPITLFPQNKPFWLNTFPDKIRFQFDKSAKVELAKSKIINMYTQKITKEEIQNKSSFLKSAAGYALFGVAGAIIGAMPENKKIEKDLTFLIIQYSGEENKSKYIVLDASNEIKFANQLINEFKEEHPKNNSNQSITINL